MELTVEEHEEVVSVAVEEAKKHKYYRLEREAKQEQQRKFQEELERPFTQRELWDYSQNLVLQKHGVALSADEQNKETIRTLLAYFTDNPLFDAILGGYSRSKGILLMGNVGTGKTLLMKAMSRNKVQCFNLVPCKAVAETYAQKDGPELVERYFEPVREAAGDYRIFNQREIGWCFDDLGAESIRKSFGNERDVMGDVLLRWYDLGPAYWNKIHLTTNLDGKPPESHEDGSLLKEAEKANCDCLLNRYGTRVYDRIREMFNVIVLDGESRR